MFRRARQTADDGAERRHREDIKWARKAIELARQNRNLQLAAILVAGAGILVPVLLTSSSSPRPAVGHAQIKLVPLSQNAIIPRAIPQLSSPPAYPTVQSGDHCRLWWDNWFPREGAAPNPSYLLIEISAPEHADVAVTGASLRVFRSYKPSAVSYIQCVYGAGMVPGTLMNVNLSRPNAEPTIVSDAGTAVPILSMPDAVINVAPGHTEYVKIIPTGDKRLYEWSIALIVVVDQKKSVIRFGSEQDPLRSWFGIAPSQAYDYSMTSHSWNVVK